MQDATQGLFEDAEVIHTYSRTQAIADGVLVDLMQGELGKAVREAGFRFPIAATARVFSECIDLTPAAKRACNDVQGRLWDVLTMLKPAAKRGGQVITFQVYVVRERKRPTLTTLKAVIGPGDNAEPVITIMFPEED